MSLYQVQQCLFDYIRALEHRDTEELPPMRTEGYTLTPDEQSAVEGGDVAALYQMGVHPVIINTSCRSVGFSRNDYRVLLEKILTPEPKRTRWQTS
jgi:hypothetical protein